MCANTNYKKKIVKLFLFENHIILCMEDIKTTGITSYLINNLNKVVEYKIHIKINNSLAQQ